MDTTITASRPAISDQDAVDDWRALGDLIDLATERLSVPVEGVHEAIVDRWSGLFGREDLSDRVFTRTIYGSVRLAGSVIGASFGIGAATIGMHRRIRPLWGSPVGGEIQAAANGLWGDEFERRTSPMHAGLAIRGRDGSRVAVNASSLRRAYPTATGRLAVLLHGLGKTERCWCVEEEDSGIDIGLPHSLLADGFTPILIRYNTGRGVSNNATSLADVLEETVENWPVAVDEVVLIGHSMGGLLARSSLSAGASAGHEWVSKVQHLVALGTPHLGSPLEKGAHIASRILDTVDVSRPLGEFIDGRSAGIKDMRHGDPSNAGQPTGRSVAQDVTAPPLDGVQHHHVAGVVTNDVTHPFGVLVGDLVVRVSSATGAASDHDVGRTDVRVFGGLDHLAILHDQAVHSQIREWLTTVPDTLDGEGT